MMICPKCGFSQPDDLYCALCGVDIEKYQEYLQRRKKRRYIGYLLISLIGIAGLSIATYIKSVRHLHPPEPVSEYDSKEVTPPGVKSYQVSSIDKPKFQRKTGRRPRADKGLSEDESTRKSLPDQEKTESGDEKQDKTKKAKEWFEKGRALDDESEAEAQCYQKAIELDPEFVPAYYFLGAIYYRQANYEIADQQFAKFLKYASEADRQAYDMYVYYSPSDVERLSEEKVKSEAPVKETKEEKAEEVEKETAKLTSEETGQETTEETKTVVRFLPVNGHIMVSVVLNGFVEAKVLVDTGAGTTVLSTELAEKLGLEGEPGSSVTLKTVAADVEAQLATLDSIQVGGLIQNNLRVAITDLPSLEKTEFDAILGMDFMNKYKINIDNENNRIVFSTSKKVGE